MTSELILLSLLAVVVLLWLDSRRVQEIAVARCRQACKTAGVQLLDDVTPIWRLRIMRDAEGILCLRRIFTFEYTTADGGRHVGSIVMLGNTPAELRLEDRTVFDAKEHRP